MKPVVPKITITSDILQTEHLSNIGLKIPEYFILISYLVLPKTFLMSIELLPIYTKENILKCCYAQFTSTCGKQLSFSKIS